MDSLYCPECLSAIEVHYTEPDDNMVQCEECGHEIMLGDLRDFVEEDQ